MHCVGSLQVLLRPFRRDWLLSDRQQCLLLLALDLQARLSPKFLGIAIPTLQNACLQRWHVLLN